MARFGEPDDYQATPTDREDAIGRILSAVSPAGALLVPDGSQAPPFPEAFERFRRLAGQVHPDRNADHRSKEAFWRASCAFDMLSAAEAGAQSLGWLESDALQAPPGSRWWGVSSADELERILEYRVALVQALARANELAGARGAAEATRCLQTLLQDSERTCELLDRRRSWSRSRLWPGGGVSAVGDWHRLSIRSSDALLHLRVVHRFCPLVGRGFDHSAELEAFSPASQANTLLISALEARQVRFSSVEAMDMDTADDMDPLDAYMAGLQAELDVAASGSATSLQKCRVTAIQAPAQPAQRPQPQHPLAQFGIPAPTLAPKGPVGALAFQLPNSDPMRGGRAAKEKAGMVRLANGNAIELVAGADTCTPTELQNSLLGDMDSDGSEVEG